MTAFLVVVPPDWLIIAIAYLSDQYTSQLAGFECYCRAFSARGSVVRRADVCEFRFFLW
jgi:hypothetical protein